MGPPKKNSKSSLKSAFGKIMPEVNLFVISNVIFFLLDFFLKILLSFQFALNESKIAGDSTQFQSNPKKEPSELNERASQGPSTQIRQPSIVRTSKASLASEQTKRNLRKPSIVCMSEAKFVSEQTKRSFRKPD